MRSMIFAGLVLASTGAWAGSYQQAYSACTSAASARGHSSVPRLCACIAAKAAQASTRAAALRAGLAALPACLARTGMH